MTSQIDRQNHFSKYDSGSADFLSPDASAKTDTGAEADFCLSSSSQVNGKAPASNHCHLHNHENIEFGAQQARRIKIFLTFLMLPLIIATVASLIYLFPAKSGLMGSQQLYGKEVEIVHAKIENIAQTGENAGKSRTVEALPYKITPGHKGQKISSLADLPRSSSGTIVFEVPSEIAAAGISKGEKITVLYSPQMAASGAPYLFQDRQRGSALWIVGALYVLCVLLVARGKGLAAVIGFLSSLAVVILFMLPALLNGSNPLWVGITAAATMLFISVYLAHGISVRTTTALLGTLLGMITTVVLSWWSIRFTYLSGGASEGALDLFGYAPHLDLQALLLTGMVVASLGALNDVSITQASAVWELYGVNRSLSAWQLYRSGLRIGKDHIASTIYTLAFAYVGTSLPVLLVASVFNRSLGQTLQIEQIAEEIVRSFVASMGLLLAIPLTTILAVILVRATAVNDK